MDEKIANRITRIQRLKELGAPRWIVAWERIMLLHELGVVDDKEADQLIDEQVAPLQDGRGYITVPDGGPDSE